jgi:hypothetical protein
MKKYLLLAVVLPSIALGIPIHLNGPESDFGEFFREGYRVEHAQEFDAQTGLTHWWVSFFCAPGAAFDAHSISGALPQDLSEILIQVETPQGDYYSQIFTFKPDLKPGFTDGEQTTMHLHDQFQNLSWLRVAGFGIDNDFRLNDVELTTTAANVPETGPGFLLLALVLAGVAFVGSRLRGAKPALCPQRRRSIARRSARRRW